MKFFFKIKYFFYLTFILIFLLINFSIYASSCCGGSSSYPNLILSDYQYRLNLSYSNAINTNVADINKKIDESNQSQNNIKENIQLGIYHKILPLWQFGFNLNYVQNTIQSNEGEDSAQKFGDTQATIGYEFLPEFTYHPFKPRGFLTYSLGIPSGESIYEVKRSDPLFVTGEGTRSHQFALILNRAFNSLDYFFLIGQRIYESHNFQQNDESVTSDEKLFVKPGNKLMMVLNLGFTPHLNEDLRLGFIFQKVHQDSSSLKNKTIQTNSVPVENNDVGLDLSLKHLNRVYSFSYIDQSFLNSARNSNLQKIFNLGLIYQF